MNEMLLRLSGKEVLFRPHDHPVFISPIYINLLRVFQVPIKTII